MFSFDSHVRYSECDENAQLSLVGMLNYLQDCSTFQSEALGIGLDFMHEHHFSWFIAAWQLEVLRLPHFTEHITISTNCYEIKYTQALRNFSIKDEQGNYCVKADSIWFTFDTQERKPCRIPDSEQAYLSANPRLDLPKTTRKLKLIGEGSPYASFEVTEQHLDTNHHVNNAQYVAMADSLIHEIDPAFSLGHLQVQYKQMALLGDTITPWVYTEDTGYTVNLANSKQEPFAIVRLLR